MKIFFKVLLANLLLMNMAYSQEKEETSVHESPAGKLRITLSMGHAHIRKAVQTGGDYGISAAAWALDADYWFSNRWALGVHSDVVLENFLIEEHLGNNEYDILEREYPIAIVPVLLFKPWHHISLLGGIGEEFSKEKNLMVFRSGLEYGCELSKNFELNASVIYDVKNTYDTWMIGLGVSKFLDGIHKHHRNRN